MYSFAQTEGHSVPRPTVIEMGELTAPVSQEGLLQRARCLAIRHVVDFPAKGIKRVQSLATLGRQQMDCPRERAAGGRRARRNRTVLMVKRVNDRIGARALPNRSVETFDRVHCGSRRNSGISR